MVNFSWPSLAGLLGAIGAKRGINLGPKASIEQ